MIDQKVSVIIPVYNAEKTIGGILQKLILQPYRNIEVIAVNDGSKDGSLGVLRGFSKKDNRIHVVDQSNAGVSTARNVGVGMATGEFITFIDADDDFSENLISELVALSDGVDFVMCGMSINGKEVLAKNVTIKGQSAIISYALGSLLTKNLFYGPYCKLFRRSVIKEFNIRFLDTVKYGEDTIFVLNYLQNARKLTVLGESLYSYNFHQAGLASMNAKNISFRRARTKALNEFLRDKLSLTSRLLYVLLRIRWWAAYRKAVIGGVIYG